MSGALWIAGFLSAGGTVWAGIDAIEGKRSWHLFGTFLALVLLTMVLEAAL